MNYHGLFRNEGLPQIRVALVGVGDFGATLLDQARNIEKIDITVICDKDEQRMRDAVRDSGMASLPMMVTDITADGLPEFDVLVEATGQRRAPPPPSRNGPVAKGATSSWRQGSWHRRRPDPAGWQKQKGVVYTEVEGDQPSLADRFEQLSGNPWFRGSGSWQIQ
ncbi:MAG: hypothetical protein CM15mP115_02120 [Alphaproteobacteria bacterium]|nr:MAG: hypothetical protein CM15mP115_02120 [Alphaproteobacteria bacterium]